MQSHLNSHIFSSPIFYIPSQPPKKQLSSNLPCDLYTILNQFQIIKSHPQLCTISDILFIFTQNVVRIMYTRKVITRLFSSLQLPPIKYSPQPFKGDAEEIIAKRLKHFSNLYQTHYKKPLIITEGHLQYLFDHKGNRYIDLQSNDGQVVLGHNHPAIKKVIQDQSGRLIHTSTIYMNETQGEYSKLLLDQLGPGFDNVYLCNSTGQAIDFSLMVSRVFTEERDIYGFRNSYHGLVGNARTVTNVGSWNSTHVDRLDCVRLGLPVGNAADGVRDVKEIIKTTSNDQPGTLVLEPVQSKGGANVAPEGFYKGVVEHFQTKKGLVISDESNSGLGRIGEQSWGFKWQGYNPDIVVIGSALGNGHALSAVATRREVASVVKHAWFNTFAAGHMQTKIGLAVINAINEEKLNENAEKVGAVLLKGFEKIAKQYPGHIGNVQGKGLLLGIDIAHRGEPSKEKALDLMQLTKKRQMLFGRGGPYGNVLLVRPPLCITKADAKYVLQAFEDAVSKLK